MSRIALMFSLAFLAASAVGRYQAERAVKNVEELIADTEREIAVAERDVRALETSRAYLERPDRLERVAEAGTDLQPLSRSQLLTAAEFVSRFDPSADPNADPSVYYPDRVIRQAQAETSTGKGGN